MCVVAVVACEEPKELSWSRYTRWLSDNQDVVVKAKEINDIRISLQFLPTDFVAYKDLMSTNEPETMSNLDSVRELYKCGLRFQLSVESMKPSSKLLFENTTDEVAYKQRIENLSFYAHEFISIEQNGKAEVPVLSQFEGYHELNNKLTIQLVFSPSWYSCEQYAEGIGKIAVVFDDPYWNTGINRFIFDTTSLREIPKLKI